MFLGGIQRLDAQILGWFYTHRTPKANAFFFWITRLGDWPWLLPFTLAVGLFFLRRRQKREALLSVLILAPTRLLADGFKALFQRPRPDICPWLDFPDSSYSLPSGHALTSTVLYGLAAYLLAQTYPSKKALLYGASGFLILAIAFSRPYLGVHWPSDVVCGMGLGAILLALAIAFHRKWESP